MYLLRVLRREPTSKIVAAHAAKAAAAVLLAIEPRGSSVDLVVESADGRPESSELTASRPSGSNDEPEVIDDERRTLSSEVEDALSRVLAAEWAAPVPGEKFGDFTATHRAGDGGFAVVMGATDASGTEGAIKVFRPTRFPVDSQREAARRFYLGAMSILRVNQRSSYAPQVIRLLTPPQVTGERLWFAMEYHAEGDLDHALASGRVDAKQAISLVDDLIEAVAIAHGDKCRHRDLRPKNILLAEAKPEDGVEWTAVVTDFDLAYHGELYKQRGTTLDQPGVVARYLPPDVLKSNGDLRKELLREDALDVYALCVVVYDMFAGRNESIPVNGNAGVFAKRLHSSANFQQLSGGLRRRLAVFLSKGLHDERNQRFGTVGELKEAWAGVVRPTKSLDRNLTALSVASFVAFGLVIIDYAFWPASAVARGVASGAVTLFSGTILGLWLWSFAQHLGKPQLEELLLLTASRKSQRVVAASMVGLLVCSVFATRAPARLRTHRVSMGAACWIGTGVEQREVEQWLSSVPADIELELDRQQLYCASPAKPRVVGHSYFSPSVEVVYVEGDQLPSRPDVQALLSPLEHHALAVAEGLRASAVKATAAVKRRLVRIVEGRVCDAKLLPGKDRGGLLIHCVANKYSLDAQDFTATSLPRSYTFHSADFSGAILRGLRARSVDFGIDTTLAGADLSVLRAGPECGGSADPNRNSERRSDLRSAIAIGVDFSGADLTCARLGSSVLSQANLSRATLDHARFWETQLDGAEFGGATLVGAVFARTDLSQAQGLTADQLCEAKFFRTSRLPGDQGQWSGQDGKSSWSTTASGRLRARIRARCPEHG